MVQAIGEVVSAYRQAASAAGGAPASNSGVGTFGELLAQFGGSLVNNVRAGEEAAIAGATGKANLADVVTAMTNAQVTLEMVVGVRDRVISAYQDIMRMSI